MRSEWEDCQIDNHARGWKVNLKVSHSTERSILLSLCDVWEVSNRTDVKTSGTGGVWRGFGGSPGHQDARNYHSSVNTNSVEVRGENTITKLSVKKSNPNKKIIITLMGKVIKEHCTSQAKVESTAQHNTLWMQGDDGMNWRWINTVHTRPGMA